MTFPSLALIHSALDLVTDPSWWSQQSTSSDKQQQQLLSLYNPLLSLRLQILLLTEGNDLAPNDGFLHRLLGEAQADSGRL